MLFRSTCCGGNGEKDAISANLYSAHEASAVPEDAILASLGCGNPTALAELKDPGRLLRLRGKDLEEAKA